MKKFKSIQKNQRIHFIQKIKILCVYLLDNFFYQLVNKFSSYYEKNCLDILKGGDASMKLT